MKDITTEERKLFFLFWTEQRKAIEVRMSEKTMYWFNIYTAPTNIGYEMSQLRPGKAGQWDLYHWLTDPEIGCDENEALIASGLDAKEVAEEAHREYHRQHGVNPDDQQEITMFERFQSMNPAELDSEIIRLEKQLGLTAIA